MEHIVVADLVEDMLRRSALLSEGLREGALRSVLWKDALKEL